jgi:hypothetical protein
MSDIEPLGLSANQWKFLGTPDRYVAASQGTDRPLDPASTRRQFRTARDILARLNGSHRTKPLKGVLLADDVGLGKTTVAALVAWVVASAGDGGRVRVLAPNEVMARRWAEELAMHVPLLDECAPALQAGTRRIRAQRTERLASGSIQVVKHSYAREATLACDLLVVDEAHRAKGERSAFSTALRRQRKLAKRVLILTATPFSIHLEELEGMLRLVGGAGAVAPVRAFSKTLNDLYAGDTSRDAGVVASRLAERARTAAEALSACVIRHGVDDLPKERASFGDRMDWQVDVPSAKSDEMEIMLRMDRALRLVKAEDEDSPQQTNDARFHVGWRHLDSIREKLTAVELGEDTSERLKTHLSVIDSARSRARIHPKIAAIGEEVRGLVEVGEKVVLFCHHHATAQELTLHLHSILKPRAVPRAPGIGQWRTAWEAVLSSTANEVNADQREAFVNWLCAPIVRAQVLERMAIQRKPQDDLARSLEAVTVVGPGRGPGLGSEARRLFATLCNSRSGKAVLRESIYNPAALPGGKGRHRVLGICTPADGEKVAPLFLGSPQPDTAIAIFNSPFGPDVLVVTDKLSEGIDLHRYCRHMIHFELDPSPIRTVQRNGRIRRVNSWAALTGKPVMYAYPAFGGTRDHRLVQIMKKRLDCFSLLLGGVQDFDLEETFDADERWRSKVVALAKKRLARAGSLLKAD